MQHHTDKNEPTSSGVFFSVVAFCFSFAATEWMDGICSFIQTELLTHDEEISDCKVFFFFDGQGCVLPSVCTADT